jgi:hypothetical protein
MNIGCANEKDIPALQVVEDNWRTKPNMLQPDDKTSEGSYLAARILCLLTQSDVLNCNYQQVV